MTVLLEAEHIGVEFEDVVAVRDVCFELAGGQLLGLVGPNGAGKTTLLRVLAGLHAPTRGTARIMGRPVLGKDETVRHHIGFGPDAPPAYEELTVDQYLGFIGGAYGLTRETTGERADFWLEQLWLTEKRRSPIKHLSKGMRQRVTLARTFLPQPHVILLDEPLSGLDPAGRIELRRVLGMLREQGCAMIVSSHILSDLEEVATHVAIIERGRILRWAATRELVQHDATVCTYELITVGGDDHYDGLLAGLDGVSNVTRDDRRYRFDYRVGEREAAGLLRQLVGLGIPVVAFHAVKATLEDAYLRAGVRQVD